MKNSINFFQPSAFLSRYVQNYYIGEFDGEPEIEGFEQRHLANGCIEMFISYDNTRSTCIDHRGEEFRTDSGIVGAHNLDSSFRGIAMEPGNKRLKFIAINFRQNGFYDIFRIPASELYNSFFSSRDLIGKEITSVQENLSKARNSNERVRCIEEFLHRCLIRNADRNYNLDKGRAIYSYINERQGNVRLDELRGRFGVSERTLQREFKSAYGFPIKEYCRISRFCSLLSYITKSSKTDWCDAVSRFGFYDQPHMINEFRSATGLAPSVYTRGLNRSLFLLYNHLVVFKTTGNDTGIFEALTGGMESSAIVEREI